MLPRDHYLKQSFIGLTQLPPNHGLSPEQWRLIKKHGTLITALLNSEVSDPNLGDLRLVKVIEQKSAPTNPLELAWQKYQALLESPLLKECG